MKRLFIIASAAIVALASCSKTQVVYNDAPEEIGFKAVTGVMTKANLDGHTTMGVFANLSDGKADYFTPSNNAKFIEGTQWKGETPRYWPLGNANLDFVFYAPYSETGITRTYTETPAENTLKIAVDNSTTQTNWLYGDAMKTGNKSTAVADVSPTMKHLLAKITINLTGTVTLKQMTLTGTEQKETATINYGVTPVTVNWTNENATKDWTFLTEDATLGAEVGGNTFTCYVIPTTDQTSITLNYALSGGAATDYTIDLSPLDNWKAGYNYIYNIIVEPGEIIFSPQVEPWTDEVSGIQFNEGQGDIL